VSEIKDHIVSAGLIRTRSIDSPKTRGHAQDGWKPANSARSRPHVRYRRKEGKGEERVRGGEKGWYCAFQKIP